MWPLSLETNLLSGKVSRIAGEGGVAVETKAGELMGRVTDDEWLPALEDQVQVSIRPEAIRLSPQGSQLNGKVMEKMYLGESIQYRVEIAEGIDMQVSEMNPRAVLEEGAQVGLKIQVEDVVLLRD